MELQAHKNIAYQDQNRLYRALRMLTKVLVTIPFELFYELYTTSSFHKFVLLWFANIH